ncbi:hypothetical protein [Bacteroides acidifaciens]|uniref:hypothetical protein n=1 Tax=Bacteroides acidifaciens TaxID=85831 RepID=UPI0026259BD4|nr:hypothetical protein [Bacteroides acidifaciens]
MHALVPVIIITIICIQVFFFVKNLLRMNQFSKIFSEESSWRLRRNEQTNLVDGVYGAGNTIFESIKNSINKYLGNNSGSVIDFGLLKDAVDRHCDSVENDIATQTPIPLYWGLAGTMAGVILGLWDLLNSNAILTLMGSSGGVINSASQNAAVGINALLSGVAWAMLASIIGILLTTANSLLFKRCKLKEENGKNSFLAWMQSELLPELPSDTSQALNNLVKNLNKFNNTFKENTSNLGNALNAVNQSYAIQADIIKAVHDMDVMKMAKANVRVLQELKECTDKLEAFNEYLDDIEGYTSAIHRFEAQFGEQADRLHILEEIRDFFRRHKSEIAKTTADADKTLQDSLENIKESTSENVNEMQKRFVEQSEHFKKILEDEKEAFERFMTQMNAQFSAQMSNMPQLAKQLEEISSIPVRLDKLIDKVEKSNAKLASDISFALKQSMQTAKVTAQLSSDGGTVIAGPSMPSWMKWTAISALVIIAAACVFNVVVYFFPKETSVQSQPMFHETVQTTPVSTPVVTDTAVSSVDNTTNTDSVK